MLETCGSPTDATVDSCLELGTISSLDLTILHMSDKCYRPHPVLIPYVRCRDSLMKEGDCRAAHPTLVEMNFKSNKKGVAQEAVFI